MPTSTSPPRAAVAATWSPNSWRGKPAQQIPVYADGTALAKTLHMQPVVEAVLRG